MSSSQYFRSWMDEPMNMPDSNLLKDDYAQGICDFMALACAQREAENTGKLICPCKICHNSRNVKIGQVWNHLYRNGFMTGYKIWYLHGETSDIASTSQSYIPDSVEERGTDDVDFGVGTIQMVNDVYRDNIHQVGTEYVDQPVEEPNLEARGFFGMLNAATHPLYEGCRDGHSPLSSASRLMTIKTDYNLPEDCMDAIAGFVKDVLPEDNISPSSYYDVQKLVAGLGLPYQVIDVCIDNCMIYWREDVDRTSCRFCRKPRFQESSGRVPIPHKRMWYLPLAERLKRLYQSERTAGEMRWHAEHRTVEGELTHPSDGEAWKHFQSTYPEFAYERRNVYLGLCTDGFNPFGKHGRQYSLWPVIVTPYNLPPSLCMRREFLFLSVLVPGPEHPKRSLDVFLQPLIHELKMLWENGVEAYDVSLKQNFQMRVVLMWTISDFPAYGMLSGWTTHGRLSCPYCQDNTDAFQLKHGRKTSWFDCHRRFLPFDHPYRRSLKLFRKKKKVFDGPPPEVDGTSLLDQLRDFGAEMTPRCGGNGHHPVDGVGVHHNWHKKSIFWDLPYWKDHLLRHNLDVMHIEKNFFDNIMNTVLNVQGKTKDNLKSRLDLVDICFRPDLHVVDNTKCPIPVYRLGVTAKQEFFNWIIRDVKFPDGYASNLRNCVDFGQGKLSGMKSHDCHVVMQRLLPFVFTHLLPKNVHEAIAGVGAFFRDICTRSLSHAGIQSLEENIPVILCNLEKIFPPSFFDVMEHLTVHLPREAALGGPVQYRWMYPFERYMFHLKKKVKNLSRVEGSIVAQCINEEASNFAEYYFPSGVSTKSRRPSRHDDGGKRPIYPVYVPSMFSEIGRFSGKGRKRKLTTQEIKHLHTYILTNCEDLLEYESIFMAATRAYYPDHTDDELNELKQEDFAAWLQFYVSEQISKGESIPTWVQELSNGPSNTATCYPRYCTRGYAFRVQDGGSRRSTSDYGISTRSGDDDVYYGVLKEIIEVNYPGLLKLRCTAFLCEWYDPVTERGVRVDQFGVTSVHSKRRLLKYDPFIIASQADQVCYIRYPQITRTLDPWLAVMPVNPRGGLYGVADHDPLQPSGSGHMAPVSHSLEVDLVIDFTTQVEDDVLHADSEQDIGEFDDDSSDSASTDNSSDSD